jgi:hypothetical protein
MNWYNKFITAQEGGAKAYVTTNAKGLQFASVQGNTFPIKDQLKAMGFRYFQGTWGTVLTRVDDMVLMNLENLGVDVSIVRDAVNAPQVEDTQLITEQPQQQPQEPLSPVDQELQNMKSGVQQAIAEAKSSGDNKVKSMLAYVDQVIDKLGAMVDESAASDFVKSFLAASAKFYTYSFGNQILIWIQKPDATKVAGAKTWMTKMGRQVTNYKNGIHIIAPMKGKSKTRFKEDGTPEDVIFFGGVKVYDISDTEPIPGWTGKEGEGPYEPKDWRQDSNEDLEEIKSMIGATWDFGKSLGIDLDIEEMSQSTGGYSAGGKVRINNTFQGINMFSTLVHELAHEILHWEDRDKLTATQQEREIDAESSAYIVLNHYGFETADTPNYIALWKGTGEGVKARREDITKAVKTIIQGIDKQISSRPMEYDETIT